uniref:Uncharacterized protein n=1 Tax=Chrysemys picta bellii TaxID=8478 RepID=A0A8C3H983_CHRPI
HKPHPTLLGLNETDVVCVTLTYCLFVHPEGSYPKPSISVSPGGVIPAGRNVIIRCRNQRLGMTFLLYKAGDGNYLTYTDPAGFEAEFPITSDPTPYLYPDCPKLSPLPPKAPPELRPPIS